MCVCVCVCASEWEKMDTVMLAPFLDALTSETDPSKQSPEWVSAGLLEVASRCDTRDGACGVGWC